MVLGRVGLLVATASRQAGLVSVWAGRYAEALLFRLEPGNPATLLMASAVLAATGVLAGWIPARRAGRESTPRTRSGKRRCTVSPDDAASNGPLG